jgi:NAD(P)-dependent dehydrogenase (short-subunit alcohol dehydrogenase family)
LNSCGITEHEFVAVVTGAASGIGLAISKAMAENGARVVLSDLCRNGADKAAANLRANGLVAESCPADVGSDRDVKKLIGYTVEKFQRIDILVNNYAEGASTSLPEGSKESVTTGENTEKYGS